MNLQPPEQQKTAGTAGFPLAGEAREERQLRGLRGLRGCHWLLRLESLAGPFLGSGGVAVSHLRNMHQPSGFGTSNVAASNGWRDHLAVPLQPPSPCIPIVQESSNRVACLHSDWLLIYFRRLSRFHLEDGLPPHPIPASALFSTTNHHLVLPWHASKYGD
jgi:hypothetical protein